MPTWLPPIITFLLGFGTKWLADWAQHRRTVEREREAREATRREQLFERRCTFQRETLLALQDAAAALGRATGRVSHLDTMAVRTTGKTQRLPDDLDEGYRLAQVRTNMLAVRVRDASIRELVEQFREFSTSCAMAKTQEDRDRATDSAMETHIKLNEQIGKVLRTLDDETESLIAR
jgi:hypothetical protein